MVEQLARHVPLAGVAEERDDRLALVLGAGGDDTTPVRIGVARFDGVCRMPTLARIAVRPAKTADPTAYGNQITSAAFPRPLERIARHFDGFHRPLAQELHRKR